MVPKLGFLLHPYQTHFDFSCHVPHLIFHSLEQSIIPLDLSHWLATHLGFHSLNHSLGFHSLKFINSSWFVSLTYFSHWISLPKAKTDTHGLVSLSCPTNWISLWKATLALSLLYSFSLCQSCFLLHLLSLYQSYFSSWMSLLLNRSVTSTSGTVVLWVAIEPSIDNNFAKEILLHIRFYNFWQNILMANTYGFNLYIHCNMFSQLFNQLYNPTINGDLL